MRRHTLDVEFGLRLAQARIRAEMTQEKLAVALEQMDPLWLSFDRTIIGKMESGLRPIRLREVQSLAEAVGCDWYWLVTGKLRTK